MQPQTEQKQTELKYKIMQYDNERDDNVSKCRWRWANHFICVPIDLQYYFDQITQRAELEAELGSITVDETPTLNKSMVEQRIRDKEHEQHVLELERKRLNEENERMMIAMDREQKRSMKV